MCTFFLVVAFRDARFLSGLYGRFSYIVVWPNEGVLRGCVCLGPGGILFQTIILGIVF